MSYDITSYGEIDKKLPRDSEIDLESIKKRKVSCEVFVRCKLIIVLSFPFK